MKFLSISGPKNDIDRVIETYISKFDIQLENALSELKTVKNLSPYTDTNPYKDVYLLSEEIKSNFKTFEDESIEDIDIQKASDVIHSLAKKIDELQIEKEKINHLEEEYNDKLSKVEQFIGLNYDLEKVLHFKFLRFRFGRISKEYYDKFYKYVYDGIDSIFYKCREIDGYIWGVYFAPETIHEKIDAIYSSMHFERFYLPEAYEGTPLQASMALKEKINQCKSQKEEISSKITAILDEYKHDFFKANKKLAIYNTNFDIRKLAACTKNKENTFYILCGWMTGRDAKKFSKMVSEDPNTFCIIEEDHNNLTSKPPTKLKNIGLFKPFEMFVHMYGLPDYKELDPTILIALCYSILFGFMFGDVGQGLVLFIVGNLISYFKKSQLAAIVARCGIFSIIFGFMFGSVFGFENILKPIWLSPKHAMMGLPLVGKLNTVFIFAISIGMGIILLTMILNIINRIRLKELGEALFDTNGLAGLIFYLSALAMIILFMKGYKLPATIVMVIMFVIPLLVIFFKEPLCALILRENQIFPNDKAMFIVQGLFELFEVLLSYFSNTLSFVRVGAFALSHAAMMEVVLMLSGMENGNPNWLIVILGNLFVIGMEGLIVGIQVLRLQYYELFSRFYHGTGRAFTPYYKK